jgi:hypothetical protein
MSDPSLGLGGQFHTSNILLNQTLNGFASTQVFSEWANSTYQEMMTDVEGMPTGGAISVRTMGIPVADTGVISTTKSIETEFETITIDPTKRINLQFDYSSIELETDLTPDTDTTMYRAGIALCTKNETQLIEEIQANTHYFIDKSTTDNLTYDDLSAVRTLQRKLNLRGDMAGFLNDDDYDALARSVRSDNVFDTSDFNAKVNRDVYVGKFGSFPLLRSDALLNKTHIAGTEGGNTLTVKAITPSTSYKEGVLSLSGATPLTGTLVDGDVLTFTNLNNTKLLSHHYKNPINKELQVVVVGDYTADGAGDIDNITVRTGFVPLDPAPTASNMYANINALPQVGDPVDVMVSVKHNYFMTKQSFHCCYTPLKDISTLNNDVIKGRLAGPDGSMPMARRSKKTNAYLRIGLDSVIEQDVILIRSDIQPVYKTFLRSVICIATAL